ncbi:MAG: methyl-accepting chemotaxis protein [Firmicutes bacterium]|nr:methyl-accepting chemotaxis protein [Bacillota bacterium]
MFYQRSLAAKIAVYIGVLLILACGGLGFLSHRYSSSAVIEEVETALEMQALKAGEYIESQFRIHLSVLEAIAARPEIKSMDWELQRPVLEAEAQRLSGFLAIGIIDRNGVARYSDGSTGNLADRDYVIRALNGQASVSDVIVSRITNGTVLMYAVPIVDNNKVVGAVLARRNAAALSDITDGLGFGDNGWAYVLGADGTLYAYPDRQLVLDQVNIFGENSIFANVGRAIRAFGLGKNGVVRYSLDDGVGRIVGLAPVPSTGWTIGVGAMEDDVLSNVNRLTSFFAGTSLTFIAVGIVLSILLGKRIAAPLIQVKEGIEALAAGDLTKTVQVDLQDEVGIVAAALNKTTAQYTGGNEASCGYH